MAVDRREVLRISLRFPGERKHLWPLLDFQIVVRFLVSASSSVPFPPAVSQVFDKSRSTESSADLGIGGSLSDQLQGQMARSSRLVLSLMRLSLGRADRTAPAVARRGYQLSNVGRLSTLSLPIDSEHTAKWMTNSDKKSPMELIAEIPPIEAHFRVVACEGGGDPSLGHPIEYINLDLGEPATCKYCGLRYVLAPDSHAHYMKDEEEFMQDAQPVGLRWVASVGQVTKASNNVMLQRGVSWDLRQSSVAIHIDGEPEQT